MKRPAIERGTVDGGGGEINTKGRAEFFGLLKFGFNKCLEPTFTCSQDAIEAHSVQRKGALSLIAVDGHVYQLQWRIEGDDPRVSLKKVGLRQASTFAGFCNAHDTDIFRPIDTKPLSTADQEQLFLLAYRSVTKELHALMQAAMRMQQAYELVATGCASRDVPKPADQEVAEYFYRSWYVWKYRYKYYDKNLCTRSYNKILHSSFVINDHEPVIACATFFFVDQKRYGKPFAAVCTNIVPLNDQQTLVVFSYAKEHSSAVRKYIRRTMMSKGENQTYELSCLLLNRTENFFISPRAVESWSPEKKRSIERAFASAIPSIGQEVERTPEMMLFDTNRKIS